MITERQPGLLSLPREIRNNVYWGLLELPNETPISPDAAGPRFSTVRERGSSWGPRILYPLDTRPNMAYAGLLQCNRQLRAECLEVWRLRHTSKGQTHRLDCMSKGQTLWPTWILFPGPQHTMQRLEMDFRLCGVGSGIGYFGGDGSPGRAFRPLFELLNRFVHHGPQFIYAQPLQNNIRLERLMINILPMDRMKDDEFAPDSSDDNSDEKLRTRVRERIFLHIKMRLKQVAAQGLLTGKIANIGVRSGHLEAVIPTEKYKPSDTVNSVWDEWGFHCGVDATATKPAKSDA